jgi:hypothetical protein
MRGGFSGNDERMFGSPPSPHSDFSCLYEPTLTDWLLLAFIGQTVTAAAREILPQAVQDRHRHPAPTVSAVAIHRTDKPRTSSAEVALRPLDRHSLIDRLALSSRRTACLGRQHDRISLCGDVDTAGRLPPAMRP